VHRAANVWCPRRELRDDIRRHSLERPVNPAAIHTKRVPLLTPLRTESVRFCGHADGAGWLLQQSSSG